MNVHHNYGQQIPIINLSSEIEHSTDIMLSDFIESITYIPLETTFDCLVDKNPIVYVTKEFIIAVGTYGCFVFNRSNGEFIREIRHYGRGPGEYRYSKGLFNEYSLTYYFTGWNGDLVKSTVDGIFRGNIKIPDYKNSFDSPSLPMNYSFLNDSILVCDFLIGTGTEPNSLMVFNEKGKVLKIVPNWNRLETEQKFVIQSFETNFYHFNNNLFFQNMYNDTVFQISSNKITPYFILNRGKYSPPFESKWWTFEKQSTYISLPKYRENNSFISFDFRLHKKNFFALYDKFKKTLKVTDNSFGLKNDIDDFVDITFDFINLQGELIGLIQANEMVKWIEKNPERSKALKPELQKLTNIRMHDNPIVVIGKYKQ